MILRRLCCRGAAWNHGRRVDRHGTRPLVRRWRWRRRVLRVLPWSVCTGTEEKESSILQIFQEEKSFWQLERVCNVLSRTSSWSWRSYLVKSWNSLYFPPLLLWCCSRGYSSNKSWSSSGSRGGSSAAGRGSRSSTGDFSASRKPGFLNVPAPQTNQRPFLKPTFTHLG